MKTTYTTEMFGDEYTLTADFAQASCPIYGDECGRQVADFRHQPRLAMKALLQQSIQYGGDDPEDFAAQISEALDNMTEQDAE